LEAAIEAVENDGRTVSALEQTFVRAGRDARDAEMVAAKRQAGRLRRLLAAVATALVVALVAGTLAFVQRRAADDSADEARSAQRDAVAQRSSADEAAEDARAAQRDAQIEALVGRSVAIRATQRDTSALLAIAAYQLADTARTRSALFSTFTENPGFLDVHRFDQEGGGAGVVMPDGVTAFVDDAEGRVRPYHLETGERGEPWPALGGGAARAYMLHSSADGRLLAHLAYTATGDTVIGVFDVGTAELVFAPIRIEGLVKSAGIGNDDGTLFVTRRTTGSLVAIDLESGRIVGELPGSDTDTDTDTDGGGGVTTIAGNRVAFGSGASVLVADAASLDVVSTIEVPQGTTRNLRRVGAGSMVVGSGFDGVALIDLGSESVVWQVIDHARKCDILAVVETADAVFCGDIYGRLVERDLHTGAIRRNLDAQNGSAGSLWSASDGTELVSFSDSEPVVARWRLDGSGPVTRVLTAGWNAGHFSPDGTKLIVSRTEARGDQNDFQFVNKVIDAATGDDIASLGEMVSATWFDDETIGGGHPTEAGAGVAKFYVSSGHLDIIDDVEPLAFDPTDPPEVNWEDSGQQRVLVANLEGTDTEIWPIDRTGRRVEPTIRTRNFSMFAASLSGHRIAVATDAGVTVYDGFSGAQLGRTARADERGVFITSAGQLITTTLGGELTVYDLETLEATGTLGGSRGFVQEAHSTIDGATVVVRGGDRFVSLYDMATGVQIGTPLQMEDDDVRFVALAQQGDKMAIGGGFSKGLRIWDLRPDTWVDAACRLAGRNLTTVEWASNIGDLTEYRALCPQFPLPDS
jgi:WD40 repeat protein